jgi:ATP-dependent DNA ligase
MFLHLSKNESVRENEIIGIFDMETATQSKETRNFLKQMQSDKKTVSLCDDLPKLVVEVRYDQVTGDRFRHGTKLVRFRPDKAPGQCTFEQIEPAVLPENFKCLLTS